MTTEARRYTKRDILELEYIDANMHIRKGDYNAIMHKKVQLKALYRTFYSAHQDHHATLSDEDAIEISDDYLIDVQRAYTVCLRALNVASDELEAKKSLALCHHQPASVFEVVQEQLQEVSEIVHCDCEPQHVSEVVHQHTVLYIPLQQRPFVFMPVLEEIQLPDIQTIITIAHTNPVLHNHVQVTQTDDLAQCQYQGHPTEKCWIVDHHLENKIVFCISDAKAATHGSINSQDHRSQRKLEGQAPVSPVSDSRVLRGCSQPLPIDSHPDSIPRKPPDRLYY